MTDARWCAVCFTAVIACVGALASACGNAADETAGPALDAPQILAVEVVQARRGTLPLFERLTGTVRATGEVAILPQASGSIVRVFAANGDAVRKGEPLVEIQAPGSQPQVAQARSSLEVARAELREVEANLEQLVAQFQRTQVLGDQGLLPVDTVVTQRAQVEAARATVARARAQVAVAEATVAERSELQRQTLVRAPIAGRVGQRNAEVGMRVDSQTRLFVIGRLDAVRVEVPVTQEVLGRIDQGQRVEVGTPGRQAPIVARVSRISPFLEPGSYSAEVEIDVPNEAGALVPGMFVTVDVFYGESQQATLLPLSALHQDAGSGRSGVFVADSAGSAGGLSSPIDVPFRPVDVVAEGPQTVGMHGVHPGEWVVVVGQHLLAEQPEGGPPRARVRAVDWDRILELQRLQREDLLRQFMEKQQRLAAQRTESAATRR